MRIIKILSLFIIMMSLLTSCAEPKKFKNEKGESFTAEPFGWANEKSQKLDTVVYQISVGNIAWSIILSETVFVPIILTGWYFYEPVRLKTVSESPQETDYMFVIIGFIIIFVFYGGIWQRNN